MTRPSVLGTIALVAVVGEIAAAPARAQPPADPGLEAMRRQVRARDRAWEAMLDHIRKLPPGGLSMTFQRVPEERAPGAGPMLAEDEAPEADEPPEEASRPRLIVAAATFDRWIFCEMSGETRRRHLDRTLEAEVGQAVRRHRLTAAQGEKLRLAGRGDIKHLFDRVEQRRRDFEPLRADPRQCQLFLLGLRPLRDEFYLGPFSAGSLFVKTLHRMTDPGPGAPASP